MYISLPLFKISVGEFSLLLQKTESFHSLHAVTIHLGDCRLQELVVRLVRMDFLLNEVQVFMLCAV